MPKWELTKYTMVMSMIKSVVKVQVNALIHKRSTSALLKVKWRNPMGERQQFTLVSWYSWSRQRMSRCIESIGGTILQKKNK
jgi:hypothetical protein